MQAYISGCIDAPDKNDYQWENFEEFAQGTTKARPKDAVVVWNQGNVGACTRFGLTHIVNGNNILEYLVNGFSYTQINPMDVWDRGDKQLYLQAALKQAKAEGLIEGYVCPTTIEQMKKSIDMGYFLYTGSSNCDWAKTNITKSYRLRSDGKFVGHAYAIVGYDDIGWIAINSYGDKRGNKGYFSIPYEYTFKLYTKYSIIDKVDNFDKYKIKEKMLALQKSNSELRALTTNEELKKLLHSTNDLLRTMLL